MDDSSFKADIQHVFLFPFSQYNNKKKKLSDNLGNVLIYFYLALDGMLQFSPNIEKTMPKNSTISLPKSISTLVLLITGRN